VGIQIEVAQNWDSIFARLLRLPGYRPKNVAQPRPNKAIRISAHLLHSLDLGVLGGGPTVVRRKTLQSHTGATKSGSKSLLGHPIRDFLLTGRVSPPFFNADYFIHNTNHNWKASDYVPKNEAPRRERGRPG